MTIKLIGALLIITGCGSIGFFMSAAHRREVNTLRQLSSILDYMKNTLQFRMQPLPVICRQIQYTYSGVLQKIFKQLADELDSQVSPNVQKCMHAALSKTADIPKLTYDTLVLLGNSLGHFGLEGQLQGLEAVSADCEEKLCKHTENQESRLRTYQTLALCAGIAIAILII